MVITIDMPVWVAVLGSLGLVGAMAALVHAMTRRPW